MEATTGFSELTPLVQFVASVAADAKPAETAVICRTRYKNLLKYLSKLSCHKMIIKAFALAQVNQQTWQGFKNQLRSLKLRQFYQTEQLVRAGNF